MAIVLLALLMNYRTLWTTPSGKPTSEVISGSCLLGFWLTLGFAKLIDTASRVKASNIPIYSESWIVSLASMPLMVIDFRTLSMAFLKSPSLVGTFFLHPSKSFNSPKQTKNPGHYRIAKYNQ